MIIIKSDDTLNIGHGGLIQVLPYLVTGKEELCLRMVDDMVYVIGLELMQNGNHNGTVRYCCNAGSSPVGAVLAAQSYAVTGFQARFLKQYMQFCDSACYVTVQECGAFIISKGFFIPVLHKSFLDESIQVFLCEYVVRSVVVINHCYNAIY